MKITQSLAGNRIRIIGSGRTSIYNYRQEIPESVPLGMNKFILFYRMGANDGGNPIGYTIASGSNKGSSIELIQGCVLGGATYCPNYPYSWTDPITGKIWVSWTWKAENGSNDRWGDDSALYSYPNSLQSWKSGDYPAGWDFWYYPNGTLAGSGSKTVDVRKQGVELIYLSCSSGRSGPYASGTLLHARQVWTDNWYAKMTTMRNGELVCLCNTCIPGNNIPYDEWAFTELWYLSSNGSWNKSLIIPSSTVYPLSDINTMGVTYMACVIPTMSGLACIISSGTKSVAFISTDYARTWTEGQLIKSFSDGYMYLYYKPIIPRDSYTDEYARLFCLETNDAATSNKGRHTFLKFNTHNNIVSDITDIETKASGCFWVEMVAPGVYYNNQDIWMAPRNKVGDSQCGDPRWLHWYNETTLGTGNRYVGPAGDSLVDPDSHGSCCVRIDDNGIIWTVGSCVRLSVLDIDMYSSNSVNGAYTLQYQDVYADDGGSVGSSFEIFR